MISKNNLVPKRRFAEFENSPAWEQRKLGEVFSSLQNNTLSRAELSYEQGVAFNIHYGDVLIKYGAVLDVKKETLPKIVDCSVIKKFEASFLRNGDIIFADTAEDETVGKCSEIASLTDESIISGLHTIPYRPQLNFASGFLGYYLNSRSYRHQLLPLMQGIKVTSISRTAMSNTDIHYPDSQDEQTRISECFRNLDHLITCHQRKCEGLHNVKKALLEEMLPQKGETVPKIRFAGFTDVWEQRKFGEIVETRRGLTYKPSDICDSGVRVLRSSNIDEDSFTLKDDDVFVRTQAVNIEYIKDKDILITAANGSSRLVGKHAIVSQIPDESTVHGGFMLLGTTEEPYFINASMGSSWYKRFIELFVAGGNGSIGNLNKNDLDEQSILVPSRKEQQELGSFFKQLDHLITLHQRKLEKLQNIKKAYLHEMFPRTESK